MLKERPEDAYYPEGDDRFEELQEEHRQILLNITESVLRTQTNLLGKGKTAEVHHLDERPHICLKIISYDTIDWSQTPHFVSLKKEAQFLDIARSIQGDVRIPRPYFSTILEEGEDSETEEEVLEDEESIQFQVLAMETLNAVTLREILEGKAELPSAFNVDSFFSKIKKYVERMNGELRLHHRDLHDGNIMVDEKGNPFIIDFGNAIFAFGEENVYIDQDSIGNLIKYTPDLTNIQKAEKRLREFLGLTG